MLLEGERGARDEPALPRDLALHRVLLPVHQLDVRHQAESLLSDQVMLKYWQGDSAG